MAVWQGRIPHPNPILERDWFVRGSEADPVEAASSGILEVNSAALMSVVPGSTAVWDQAVQAMTVSAKDLDLRRVKSAVRPEEIENELETVLLAGGLTGVVPRKEVEGCYPTS